MSNDIKHFFSETAESSSLVETLAREVFASTHPEERVGRAKCVADELDRFVVCVQHGAITAPSLVFYAVSKRDRSITVLADDELYRPARPA